MAKKKKPADTEVDFERFTVPAFRYEGVEYNSAQVEKAANAGDEKALAIIANLIAIGSGIVVANQIEEGGAHE